ncbi:PD-(D/E)XK nuclease superfamily protein [Natranaerovirga hydrolytica]|uniref:PD-(D/E)XK nuclease superfamily protein n=1 Tax=Natranaerovirga hydrolytica TaxID=680378 RepID=A0A4R1N1Z9_9FIRM|nr:hypothetical protein [Natranaerovirga hydrolytica]TCK98024.1 PD-(D/E)XK nuclease superfamily protein [Natranaerovirga hydrolytica]
MTKFEYSDFHKFIVSLGTGLVVLAFTIPWFFLRESFGILVEENEIQKFPEKVQTILDIKQETIVYLLKFIPIISGIFGVIGVVLIIYGFINWSRKQQIIDKKEKASLDKALSELRNITTIERLESIEQDIDNERNDESELESEDNHIAIDQSGQAQRPSYSQNMQHYFNIERLLNERLNTIYRDDYIIRSNQRLGNHEFDVIMLARNNNQTDKLIEIKYYKSKNSILGIRRVIERVQISQQRYNEQFNRDSHSIVIIIVPESTRNEIGEHRLSDIKNRYEIQIEFICEEELNCFNLTEII